MSRLQSLKGLIYQRLTAAVEEIIGHLERTITEYEEEVKCCHGRLLGTGSKPDDKPKNAVFSTDVQQLLLIKEEQKEWIPSLDQEEPDLPHIKEEQHEQVKGLHEEDITEFSFIHVPVKSEDDGETPQSSQLHQRHTLENREAEYAASSSTEQVKAESRGEDCGGSETDTMLDSESGNKTSHSSDFVTENCGDEWEEIRKPPADFNTMKNKDPVNYMGHNADNKPFSCSKCGKRFGQKHHLQTHMRCHTGEKPFSCSLCGKRFTQKGNLTQHLRVHTREKPCSCPVCGERFAQKGNLTQHMTVHTRERLCW